MDCVTMGALVVATAAQLAGDGVERLESQIPLALDGRCPVTLVQQRTWVPGKPDLAVTHKGLRYLFATEQQRDLFRAEPKKYVPACGGCDVVRMVEEGRRTLGNRRHGLWCADRMFLFETEESLEAFIANPRKYLEATPPE